MESNKNNSKKDERKKKKLKIKHIFFFFIFYTEINEIRQEDFQNIHDSTTHLNTPYTKKYM